MPIQRVMDHTGDTVHTFDPANSVEVKEAEKRFMELTGEGFTPAVKTGPGQSTVTRAFDPTAEETLFIPRLKGG